MARVRKQHQQPTRRSERVQNRKAELSQKVTEAKVVKSKRFRRPKQRKACRLLALPGELRNRIYRHALVQQDEITLTAKDQAGPPLLEVCRAIRREAAGIYYGENDFTLNVEDYNGAVFVPFARQYYRFGALDSKREVYFRFGGGPNWDNLVEWIKAHYLKNAMIPVTANPTFPSDFIVGGAFKVVSAMRWTMWEWKEEALQAFYHGLKGTCCRWVKDEDRMQH